MFTFLWHLQHVCEFQSIFNPVIWCDDLEKIDKTIENQKVMQQNTFTSRQSIEYNYIY